MDRAALKYFRRLLKSLMLIFQVATMSSLLSLLACGEENKKNLCPDPMYALHWYSPTSFKMEIIIVIAI